MDPSSRKRKRNGYLMRLMQQSGKREAKGKDKKRYQELKAEVQRKLRVDKQQQLEGMRMELEAANSKGNSRQLFQIVKSMTRKFQPRLQGIQSAAGENLTEAAQIADRWKGYCEDLYCDEEGNGIEQEYWEQETPQLRSEVARAIRQTASCKATGPDEIRLMKVLVWPVATYGCESWTLRKNEETCLDTFEMKGLEKASAGFVDSKENK